MKLAALGQTGLAFGNSDYDLDRYRQVSALAAELLAVASGHPAAELAAELGRDFGYVTPKVDVRGAIFDDHERVLLMREKTDGRWSLPGGWDREVQAHVPPLPVAVFKLFFLCRPDGAVQPPSPLETLEVGWFGLDE